MRSHEIPDDVFQLLERASRDVHRDENREDWDPLSQAEPLVTVWAIYQAQGVIDNGGLQYFFENDWPRNPPYSVFIGAYRAVGANEAADCLEEAVRLFPRVDPEADLEMRRDFMDSMTERFGKRKSPFDQLAVRLLNLGGKTMIGLADYVQKHREHFPSA
jgi:Domain of unknown function (DUF4375)